MATTRGQQLGPSAGSVSHMLYPRAMWRAYKDGYSTVAMSVKQTSPRQTPVTNTAPHAPPQALPPIHHDQHHLVFLIQTLGVFRPTSPPLHSHPKPSWRPSPSHSLTCINGPAQDPCVCRISKAPPPLFAFLIPLRPKLHIVIAPIIDHRRCPPARPFGQFPPIRTKQSPLLHHPSLPHAAMQCNAGGTAARQRETNARTLSHARCCCWSVLGVCARARRGRKRLPNGNPAIAAGEVDGLLSLSVSRSTILHCMRSCWATSPSSRGFSRSSRLEYFDLGPAHRAPPNDTGRGISSSSGVSIAKPATVRHGRPPHPSHPPCTRHHHRHPNREAPAPSETAKTQARPGATLHGAAETQLTYSTVPAPTWNLGT
ncbi:hypothetical protein VFPBJ_10863 [Purpureocillium lilacinum]|uniref:Uncharacterized protein n=1 Tax=Purpureocillium lilacinum TaxID=33203 RepID=A0A179FW74_PURLI|nr:hypothetical protein VFPBJ_10863 [Purpureocillium lilacinum]